MVSTAGVGVLCQLECEGPFRAEVLKWMPGYTAIEILNPIAQRSHTAPINEKGTDKSTIPVCTMDFVFMYNKNAMIKSVKGKTTFSRSRTRSIFSYWPLHNRPYPWG